MAASTRRTHPSSSSLKPITRMASVTARCWLLSSLSEACGRGLSTRRVRPRASPPPPRGPTHAEPRALAREAVQGGVPLQVQVPQLRLLAAAQHLPTHLGSGGRPPPTSDGLWAPARPRQRPRAEAEPLCPGKPRSEGAGGGLPRLPTACRLTW